MAEPEVNRGEKLEAEEVAVEPKPTGTWFGIGVVGFVILATNVLLLWLYMDRLGG